MGLAMACSDGCLHDGRPDLLKPLYVPQRLRIRGRMALLPLDGRDAGLA